MAEKLFEAFPDLLDRLDALEKKSTQGEWITFANRLYRQRPRTDTDPEGVLCHNDHLMAMRGLDGSQDGACWICIDADAQLICLMRNSLKLLLHEARKWYESESHSHHQDPAG